MDNILEDNIPERKVHIEDIISTEPNIQDTCFTQQCFTGNHFHISGLDLKK
jgi:hypothetical protein